MADEGRVSVNSKQTVLRIHEKLKKEVHQIAEKKSWTAKQKDEFEKNLLEVGQLSDFPCILECGNLCSAVQAQGIHVHSLTLFCSSDRFICLCLIKLYKDSVEETVKENISIGGQQWDSVSQAEVSSGSEVHEGNAKS